MEHPDGPSHPPPTVKCPYCDGLLATDLAKQCLHCGMDWHDPDHVRRLGDTGGDSPGAQRLDPGPRTSD